MLVQWFPNVSCQLVTEAQTVDAESLSPLRQLEVRILPLPVSLSMSQSGLALPVPGFPRQSAQSNSPQQEPGPRGDPRRPVIEEEKPASMAASLGLFAHRTKEQRSSTSR